MRLHLRTRVEVDATVLGGIVGGVSSLIVEKGKKRGALITMMRGEISLNIIIVCRCSFIDFALGVHQLERGPRADLREGLGVELPIRPRGSSPGEIRRAVVGRVEALKAAVLAHMHGFNMQRGSAACVRPAGCVGGVKNSYSTTSTPASFARWTCCEGDCPS